MSHVKAAQASHSLRFLFHFIYVLFSFFIYLFCPISLFSHDKNVFMKIYQNLVKLQVQLDECKLHLDLIEHVKELLEITDFKITQAVKRALGKPGKLNK